MNPKGSTGRKDKKLKKGMNDTPAFVPQMSTIDSSHNVKWLEEVEKSTNGRVAEYMRIAREVRVKKTQEVHDVTKTVVHTANGRKIVKLPTVKAWEDTKLNARKYILGKPLLTDQQRNVLVIGTNDCGKNTLIDCMVNYTLGVKWSNNFTLGITAPNARSNDQNWINVYSIPSTPDTVMPFALNIVDMPEFGATPQSQVDKIGIGNLTNFMKSPKGHEVDCFSAIWFIHNGQNKTIPPMYLHTYKELVKNYGEEIADKVTNVITFAKPDDEVRFMKAIADTGLPSKNKHFLNHMTAFNRQLAEQDLSHNELEKTFESSWDVTIDTVNNLSTKVESEKPMSLHISPEDLERRNQAIDGLRQLITLVRMGCQKLVAMHKEKDMIQKKVDMEQAINQVDDFQYKICKPVKVRRELPYCGVNVTNCSICFITCHAKCAIANDDAKERCCAMSGGFCTVCPENCYWDQHFNRAFQIFVRMETHTKKLSDLAKEFKVDDKKKVRALVEALTETSDTTAGSIKTNIHQAVNNMATINKISGKDASLSYNDYIDIIIHEEMRDGMLEWARRVDLLKMFKEVKAPETIQFMSKRYNQQRALPKKMGRLGVKIQGKDGTAKMF